MENNYFGNNDWLQQRLGRFTSSEIHKLFVSSKKKGEIFGTGANTYIRKKVAELLTLEVKEEVDFKQGEWGKANEYDGVRTFEEATGKKGTYYGCANPTFFEFGEYGGCSPDWEIEGEEGADIKCPYNTDEHILNLRIQSADEFKKLRWEYYCQGQMSMLIRKWKVFHFVSYDPRLIERKLRLKIISAYPDGEWIGEFTDRFAEAVDDVKRTIALLDKSPSVLICEYDNELEATLIRSLETCKVKG